MIARPTILSMIRDNFRVHPVTALLGPRQCGKTTLARVLAGQENSTYFDLENPADLSRLTHPLRSLESLSDLVVIDEIQRRPDIFEILRVLVDRNRTRARFLVLGSASFSLVKGVSESLAGRIGFVDMSGFSLSEVGADNIDRLWIQGSFPLSYLNDDVVDSFHWREDFIRTYLERDIPQLGIFTPAETLRRFWTMMAHYQGQVWNAAEFARSLGSAENTARRYLDILTGSYMVRKLMPWFENINKRQVKSPKIYIRDSGVLHTLLHMPTLHDLRGHPKLGASWEGFALEQLLTAIGVRDYYFWASHGGAELDLLLFIKGKRHGFEFKYGDAPRTNKSMHSAISTLGLNHLWVIHPGDEAYPLDDRITAWPLKDLAGLTSRILTQP